MGSTTAFGEVVRNPYTWCGPGTGLDLVPRSPLNVVQMPAKAVRGLSSLSANQATSFFFVSGFGSGAYSAKLLKGTRHRFSGFSQPRQSGDDVQDVGDRWTARARRWRHGPPHHRQFGARVGIADHGGGVLGKHAWHRREIADVSVDDAEEGDDGRLVGCDRIEIAHRSWFGQRIAWLPSQ